MKILVFGQSGQVAQELALRCPQDITAHFLSRHDADLTKPEDCAHIINKWARGCDSLENSRPDVVINAAAWTAVDKAESDEGCATIINGDAPGAIAKACAHHDIPFLHLSTDYVFDGSGNAPFAPNDQTNPLGAYGRSKLAGEKKIQSSLARYLILRTSWVVSSHGSNFVKTMLRLGQERDELSVVADQIGGPTPASFIADTLFDLARAICKGAKGGIYHFSGAPDISWAGFAREIMARAELDCRIHDITTDNYPTPAKRPLNSRLDCSGLYNDFGISRPEWHQGLDGILSALKEVS